LEINTAHQRLALLLISKDWINRIHWTLQLTEITDHIQMQDKFTEFDTLRSPEKYIVHVGTWSEKCAAVRSSASLSDA
jgi:hypothetical protein